MHIIRKNIRCTFKKDVKTRLSSIVSQPIKVDVVAAVVVVLDVVVVLVVVVIFVLVVVRSLPLKFGQNQFSNS